ncbi:hypothetical protein LCGC14_1458830 [marine sediment metagenome]|uniref:Uncharacterized protein n=1 Tax=marine sediment metagenome TaxID=412755 RepID=A0A0F9MHN7_9ZZZZ
MMQLTKESFEAEWWEIVQGGIGYIAAYKKLELSHIQRFGKPRYASYKSFSQVRDYKK